MWLPIGLLTAIFASLLSPINKHQTKTIHPIALLFVNQVFTIICMSIIVIFLGGIPHVTEKFFLFMLCSSILDTIAFSCSYIAIRKAPISLLSPLGSFVPVFATFFGFLFLQEIPTPLKLAGILTIVVGMYLLNISQFKEGFFKPIQKLFSHPGVRLYFVEVILFGITPIFQKQAIFEITPSMPLFASFIGNSLVTLYLLFFGFKKARHDHKAISKNWWFFLLFGIINTFGQLGAYYVFSTTYVGYATAIFSLSSLFTVLLGGMLFKESNIRERLVGAFVMIIGVVLLAI